MIIKTHAIALKVQPFSETSQIVTWMTAEHGKIATIIKGAQRPRNGFLGQYDLFYTCEVIFYLRLFQGLHIVKECFPLKPRPALRSYWPGTACASYFAALTSQIAPLYAPHENVYALLDTALDYFSSEHNPPAPLRPAGRAMRSIAGRPASSGGRALEMGLFWFELKLLAAMGFAPRLNACLQCQRPLLPGLGSPAEEGNEASSITFSAAQGGVMCKACSDKQLAKPKRIAPDNLALLRFWQSSKNIEATRNFVCNELQVKEVGNILGGFIQHHFEMENAARKIALALLGKRGRWPAIKEGCGLGT